MVPEQWLSVNPIPWGTLSPRPPGIYRFGAKIENGRGLTSRPPFDLGPAQALGLLPSRALSSVRLKSFIPLARALCNRQLTIPE
jgi:hypothetical protein